MKRNKARLIAAALSLCLCLSLSAPALAEGDTLYINSAADFVEFAQSCSYDAWSRGRTVVLQKDISLGGIDYLPAASFGGEFDGGGHTISGLTLEQDVSPAGLFGVIEQGARVHDLKVDGSVSQDGGERTGGIAGVNRGTIEDCTFTGTVSGGERTGGIVGVNERRGSVRRCETGGGVFGKSMTGGVAGSNAGTLEACYNRSYVNTNTLDPSVTLDDLDLSLDGLARITSPDTFNIATDSGGVAGYSDGVLMNCRNYGSVGHQHIGYNVGGIAGRSSGHISGCTNEGRIFGRKDVGGVCGMAEPYVILDVTESSMENVRRELDVLSELVDDAATGAERSSAALSARLTAVSESVGAAEDRAQDLTGDLTSYWDGTVSEINRGSDVVSGALSQMRDASAALTAASGTLTEAVGGLSDAIEALGSSVDGGLSGLSAMAADLQRAATLTDEGTQIIQEGLHAFDGTVTPRQGLSEDEWRRGVYGTTGADGAHVPGAIDNMRNGLAQTVSGLNEVTGILNGFVSALSDGSISDIAGAQAYFDAHALSPSFDKAAKGIKQSEAGLTYLHENTDIHPESAKRGFDELREGFDLLADGEDDDAGGVFYYLSSAMGQLGAAADAASVSTETLTEPVRGLRDACAGLTDALGQMEGLLGYLENQDQLRFSPLGEAADESANALYASLHDVSGRIDALGGEMKDASDDLAESVRKINRQFMRVMDTLFGVVEEAENTSPSTLVEDTSDEDIDAVMNGKIYRCANTGAVDGDIDAGGVAGAMDVYNEFNPEGDDVAALSSSFHRRYELKCILQECGNTGAVTGKRSNIGAVCGSGRIGVISGCEGCGSAGSESGDYVGGIVGWSDNVVRKCSAKCTLSGRRYVGGIVGAGEKKNGRCTVENCRSLVEVTDCEQFDGAIAGYESGSFSGNRFVSDTLAGVNRVSRSGEAEPISYEELIAEEGASPAFRRFTLTFVAEDRVIKSVPFNYGDSFGAEMFPAVPQVEGSYGRWDRDTLTNLCFDTVVTAVYAPYVTALESALTRSASRPVFFVEGSFGEGDTLDADPTIMDFDAGDEGLLKALRSYRRSIVEQWQLTLPEGSRQSHVFRYLPPEDRSGSLAVYGGTSDGGWTRLATGEAGSYLTFELPGDEVRVTVLSDSTPWWVWAAVGVLVLGLALLALSFIIRRKQPVPATPEEKAAAAVRKKKHRRVRLILAAAVLALGVTVGLILRLAPDVTESTELYFLLRGVAERSELDMRLEAEGQLAGRSFDTAVDLFTTDFEGHRVSCANWQGIPVYYCDGVMLLENGKAFTADGLLPDYTQLLSHAATLYRSVEVSASELGGVKTYHAAADGEAADRLAALLLPRQESIPAAKYATVDLVTTDGELTNLRIDWAGGENEAKAVLTFRETPMGHSLPTAVEAAVRSGEYLKAPEAGEALSRLILAWTELSAREPLTAEVGLSANCGPLLLDEELTWQRTGRYGPDVSRLTRRDTTLYFTDGAACTEAGLAVNTGDTSLTDTSKLLRLAYRALLLGEADCEQTASGEQRYTLTLDDAAMAELAQTVAPEVGNMSLSFRDGSCALTVTEGRVTAASIQCSGTVRIALRDVPATISARLDFDQETEAFPELSEAVRAALDLPETNG